MTIVVASVEELQEAVAGCAPGRRLLPVAGGSKPPLSTTGSDEVDSIDVSALRGVVEYDPAELTLTALAGTPVADVARLLAEHGQYLPFDPPLAASGATLGGVVAAGASGPSALRHGTVRDFVIGIRFVDGTGHLVGGGGKVVKNAAGFDLPKLFVGSLGRLGVITQLSFKVFPRPRATVTLEFALGDTAAAVAAACACVASARELDAIDVLPKGRLLVRLGGDPTALSLRATRLVGGVLASAPHLATYEADDDAALWADAAELRWAGEGTTVVVVPVTAPTIAALEQEVIVDGGEMRISLAANAAWIGWPESNAPTGLDRVLRERRLTGVAIRGRSTGPLIGAPVSNAFGDRVRRALDPHDRFLET